MPGQQHFVGFEKLTICEFLMFCYYCHRHLKKCLPNKRVENCKYPMNHKLSVFEKLSPKSITLQNKALKNETKCLIKNETPFSGFETLEQVKV